MSEVFNLLRGKWAVLETGECGTVCGYNALLGLLVIAVNDGYGVDWLENATIVTHKNHEYGYLYADYNDVISYISSN